MIEWLRRRIGAQKWAEYLLVLAGVTSIVALSWHHMAILGDGFWYIATGRWILRYRRLPHEDPFCFATVSQTWTLVNVGSQLLFAKVADQLGLRSLMVLMTIVESIAASWLWLGVSRRATQRLMLLPVALLFIQLDAEDLSARGQIFGDLGFVALLFLMQRLRQRRVIAWFVPLAMGCVWVNLHMSYLLAVFVPLLWVGALSLEPTFGRAAITPFVRFSGLALVGSLANPYGYKYWVHTLKNTVNSVAGSFDLFQSPNLQSLNWLTAPALAIVLVVARSALGHRRGRRADTALLLALLFAACSARRYVTQLMAVEAIVLGAILERYERPLERSRSWVPLFTAAYSCVLLSVSWSWLGQPKDPTQHVPAAAADFVTTHGLGQNIMNPFHWGGYLAYAWNGSPKYFIDGRDIIGLVDNGLLDDSVRLRSGTRDWQRILDAYEINTVIWERGEPLDFYLAHSAAWQPMHRDALAVVYSRRQRHQPGL